MQRWRTPFKAQGFTPKPAPPKFKQTGFTPKKGHLGSKGFVPQYSSVIRWRSWQNTLAKNQERWKTTPYIRYKTPLGWTGRSTTWGKKQTAIQQEAAIRNLISKYYDTQREKRIAAAARKSYYSKLPPSQPREILWSKQISKKPWQPLLQRHQYFNRKERRGIESGKPIWPWYKRGTEPTFYYNSQRSQDKPKPTFYYNSQRSQEGKKPKQYYGSWD